jgi:hypothetical protein
MRVIEQSLQAIAERLRNRAGQFEAIRPTPIMSGAETGTGPLLANDAVRECPSNLFRERNFAVVGDG